MADQIIVSAETDSDGDGIVQGTPEADDMPFAATAQDLWARSYDGDDLIAMDGSRNRAYAGAGNDTVVAGGDGNWVFTGSGSDTVVITADSVDPVIFDFDPLNDRLVFDGIAGLSEFSSLSITQAGTGNAIISFGTLRVKLRDVPVEQLDPSNLLFGLGDAEPNRPPAAIGDDFTLLVDPVLAGNALANDGNSADRVPNPLTVTPETGQGGGWDVVNGLDPLSDVLNGERDPNDGAFDPLATVTFNAEGALGAYATDSPVLPRDVTAKALNGASLTTVLPFVNVGDAAVPGDLF